MWVFVRPAFVSSVELDKLRASIILGLLPGLLVLVAAPEGAYSNLE